MKRELMILCVAVLGITRLFLGSSDGADITIPWSSGSVELDQQCRWERPLDSLLKCPHRREYIAPPEDPTRWEPWFGELTGYRKTVRANLHNLLTGDIVMRFNGVRSWVRVDRKLAYLADLAPKETIVFRFRAKREQKDGNGTLCAAFDFCDRGDLAQGRWLGWSEVLETVTIPDDGEWHALELRFAVPEFDRKTRWARPILGMDGTFDKTPGTVRIRDLTVTLPGNADGEGQGRGGRLGGAITALEKPSPEFDDSLYRREDLMWMRRSFVCGFIMIYDSQFWDAKAGRYRVDELVDEAKRDFGGYDSVVLWQAYPRLGVDARNQFDFYRDMPGGLDGVRKVVDAFHASGVNVFLPFNPWDQAMRPEPGGLEVGLTRMVAALDADGVFLDTMFRPPHELRRQIDAVRPGVIFEPEGQPPIEQMESQNGSWAQWLKPYEGIGVLHLKWIEQRHMQHQIHRWDRSHREELAAAWINGSGILVWENVFGSWNPWNASDRAALRRMAPVWRRYADLFAEGRWLPFVPTLEKNVYASCWEGEGVRLWTFINPTKRDIKGPLLEVDDRGETFYDLWTGRRIETEGQGGRIRIAASADEFGGVLAVRDGAGVPEDLLKQQETEAARPIAAPEDDPHVRARSLVKLSEEPPKADPDRTLDLAGMLRGAGGKVTFVVRHPRRECGCYPDADTHKDEHLRFTTGENFREIIEHRRAEDLAEYWIDAKPVTNAQYAAFLKATGYRPKCAHRFLDLWSGKECPDAIKDEPVVYVDIDDARAYAAWAGMRLPSEWEWQRAAEIHGKSFSHDAVREWTESCRDDGHTRFVMLRGGCSFDPIGSGWYVPSGIRPVDSHTKFLRMYPGLDRCSTIGFRCAK